MLKESKELTASNIIQEINNDILKVEENTRELKCDIYMCRFNLFQFFQLKYLDGKNRDYIGYIMDSISQKDKDGNITRTYSMANSYISSLNRAKILEEIKEIKYDDNHFELIKQYYSDEVLKDIFLRIIEKENINIESSSKNIYEIYKTIKDQKPMIFTTYIKKRLKNGDYGKKYYINAENRYFLFRFFKLSKKYQEYEKLLFEELKKEFGWRLNYKIVRNF